MKPLLLAFASTIALGCSSADFEVGTSRTGEMQSDAEQETSMSVDSSEVDTGVVVVEDTSPGMVDTSVVDTGSAVDTATPIDTATSSDTATSTDTGTSPKDTGAVECVSASTCPSPPGECMTATCIAGKCGIAPKPAGSFCHGFDDQCDGAGNCIDCVNSGGCGECCVCSGNTCIPA